MTDKKPRRKFDRNRLAALLRDVGYDGVLPDGTPLFTRSFKQRDLAAKYRVSEAVVSNILNGRAYHRWTGIPPQSSLRRTYDFMTKTQNRQENDT